MLFALLAAAFAAEPPSLDPAVATGAKAKKDAALVVGVHDYKTLPDAEGAARDAEAFAALLTATVGVPEGSLTHVTDPDAAALRAAVSAAAKAVRNKGTLWIYVSGHGGLLDEGQRVILGADAAGAADGVPLAEILRVAEASKAKRVVAIVDAAYGGATRDGERMWPAPEPAPDAKPGESRTIPPPGVTSRTTLWLSTSGAEPAYLYPATKHGLFTYFAAGALRGWADGATGANPDGAVTLQEAQAYVGKAVRTVGGGEQRPGKEARANVAGWTLTRGGALQAGPSKEDLAALALAEKTRRVKKAEGVLLGKAKAEWTALSPTAQAASPEATTALQAFIAKYDVATVTVDGTQIAVAVPEVAEARARLDGFARLERKGKKRKKKVRRPPPPPPVSPTAACMDLVKLEPAAITGTLAPDQVECIEARLGGEKLQTARDKLSRLLLVNADARGDVAEWERLTERHLEDIDRSDPDLCFKYALLLSRGAVEDAESVLRWTDYALENKHVWEGPTYMSRVYNLLRLRAETATRLWHEAEDDFMAERSDENADLSEKARGRAKDSAKEWLDYARTSNQPLERASVLCQSASGSASFCGGA